MHFGYSGAVLQFSVIIPVCNGEKFIRETVESVIHSLRKFEGEIIIIDDGSVDLTPNILAEITSDLHIISQENQGQASAVNAGIFNAKGKYSIIVNADDPLIDSELFESAWRILEENSAIVGTYPDWNLIDDRGAILEQVNVKDFSQREFVGRFNCLIGPGGIFRTKLAKEINGWNPMYKFVPDYDFWLRLSKFGDFRHVNRVQAQWRSHSESISIGSRGKRMAEERIAVITSHVKSNPQIDKNLARMALANAYYRAGMLSYFDATIPGYKYALRAIRLHPKILIESNFGALIFMMFSPVSSRVIQTLGKIVNLEHIAASIQKSVKK